MWEIIKNISTQVNNLIGAALVLLIGFILGLIVKKTLRKILHEFELDQTIKKLGKNCRLEKSLSSLAAYLIYFIALILSLNQLGITSIVLYIVLGAILLLIGATLLLAVKDFLPNLIGGILAYRQGYRIGNQIRIDDIKGKIEKLGLLEIEIRTKKGDKIYLPNSLLNKSKIIIKK